MNDPIMSQIVPAAWDELDAISNGLPERPKPLHSQRILQQTLGHCLYLLAWEADTPVGHVIVKWPNWPERPWAVEWQARYRCCFIEDLWVLPSSRNQGTGKALMASAESHCLAQGTSRVGLHVGLDEGYHAALHIYHSTGYRGLGHGLFIESSPGSVEPVIFLLKELT
jgi:GNAT superfamily N-acetyltransferase